MISSKISHSIYTSFGDNRCRGIKVGYDHPSRYATCTSFYSIVPNKHLIRCRIWPSLPSSWSWKRVLRSLRLFLRRVRETQALVRWASHTSYISPLWSPAWFASRHLPPRTNLTERPNHPTYFGGLGCGHFDHSGWNDNSLRRKRWKCSTFPLSWVVIRWTWIVLRMWSSKKKLILLVRLGIPILFSSSLCDALSVTRILGAMKTCLFKKL